MILRTQLLFKMFLGTSVRFSILDVLEASKKIDSPPMIPAVRASNKRVQQLLTKDDDYEKISIF